VQNFIKKELSKLDVKKKISTTQLFPESVLQFMEKTDQNILKKKSNNINNNNNNNLFIQNNQ
jgi:hypothetical protein